MGKKKKRLPDKTYEKDLGKNDLEKQMQATFNCPTQSETQNPTGSPPIISKLDSKSS